MQTFLLERSQVVPESREDVFAFFEDAANLERLTPPFLGFRIVTPPPIVMREGTLIDYRIRLFGVPLGWRTRIDAYEPPFHFVDTQLKGPYRHWRHTHEFSEVPEGTRVSDRVEYALGFGPLGAAAHTLFVRRTLARIFDYRRQVIAHTFTGRSSKLV